MSKQLKVQKEGQMFSILELQLKRQDEQGKTIHTMFDSIKSMYSSFTVKFDEMTEMVQEVRDSVTLNNAECTMIQSAVALKSIQLTKDRFAEEDATFNQVVGKYRRCIWSNLKKKYSVPKYNCIRRIDFDGSIEFVAAFRPEDYL